MKKYALLLFLFATQVSYSQEEIDKSQQFNIHKYEVGIDFKYLFNWNSGLIGRDFFNGKKENWRKKVCFEQ